MRILSLMMALALVVAVGCSRRKAAGSGASELVLPTPTTGEAHLSSANTTSPSPEPQARGIEASAATPPSGRADTVTLTAARVARSRADVTSKKTRWSDEDLGELSDHRMSTVGSAAERDRNLGVAAAPAVVATPPTVDAVPAP